MVLKMDAPADLVLNSLGELFLWIYFGIFGVISTAIFLASFSRNPNNRFWHYACFGICGIAALAYCCMALHLGVVKVNGREVYIWRFADWAATTPLTLMAIVSFAKLSGPNIFGLVLVDEIMIFAGLFSTLTTGYGSWILFTIGIVNFLPILFFLLEDFDMGRTINNVGEVAARSYHSLGYFLIAWWSLYPVVHSLACVSIISVDVEAILYGILDIFSKGVFCSWMLWTKPESEFIQDMEKDLEMEIELERQAQQQESKLKDF